MVGKFIANNAILLIKNRVNSKQYVNLHKIRTIFIYQVIKSTYLRKNTNDNIKTTINVIDLIKNRC